MIFVMNQLPNNRSKIFPIFSKKMKSYFKKLNLIVVPINNKIVAIKLPILFNLKQIFKS